MEERRVRDLAVIERGVEVYFVKEETKGNDNLSCCCTLHTLRFLRQRHPPFFSSARQLTMTCRADGRGRRNSSFLLMKKQGLEASTRSFHHHAFFLLGGSIPSDVFLFSSSGAGRSMGG